MPRFTLPRDLYFGPGAIQELKNLKGAKRAMILTGGSSMKKGGFLQKVQAAMEGIGAQVSLFEGIEPDPSIETVYRGAQAMQEFQPDVIIAIGGGSPLDAAKAMWVFYEYPEKSFEDIKTPFTMPKLRQKAIFVAIPSTSGTDSEVTAFSVITDYSTNIKYPLADFEITPDIAILDTDIPLTMPKTLTAHTGMDALTHAIEAYVATAHSEFSDALAIKAITDIYDCILPSYHGDAQARGKMHIAQCMAGMAFSNALLGIAHSLAHKTGAMFGIPHGCCNAVLLPAVIQYNAPACPQRYAAIARAMGLYGGSDRQLVNALVDAVRALNAKLDIAPTYAANGVTPERFDACADEIARNAVADPCTASNPRPIAEAAMKRVLTCAYTGEDIYF